MKAKPHIWYSFSGEKAEKNQIGFYNTGEFDWVKDLESNYLIIREELLNYVEQEKDQIKPYFNKNLVAKKSVWRTSAFLFWKWNFRKNQKICPKTMKIIKQIPNLISASISILEPESEIKPHRGDTNGIIRGHLPLIVPNETELLGFQVNDEIKIWEEGKLLLFNDAAYHSAWNRAQSDRIVMIIDVVRPEFIPKTYRISSTILSSLVFQSIVLKISIIRKLPQVMKNAVIRLIAIFINPLLRIQNI
ncbi:MAG: aspartyl/asparaginyl beta-hydroxylase domain-containing protein [Saprospiraceae bacterium]|nr:aspartyl/asparaginyl beta-hydroxylase domain-containing protein [Saprospiraceae bacterium]